MKLRHAAAIALVLLTGCSTGQPVVAAEPTAWKIMQPPWIEGRPYPTRLDETAPLSEWIASDRRNYPTQNECEQALERLGEELRRTAVGLPKTFKPLPNPYDKARCVSTDDPNLR